MLTKSIVSPADTLRELGTKAREPSSPPSFTVAALAAKVRPRVTTVAAAAFAIFCTGVARRGAAAVLLGVSVKGIVARLNLSVAGTIQIDQQKFTVDDGLL